jgi:hypothetical protein
MKNIRLVPAIALLVFLGLPFLINLLGLDAPAQTYTFIALMDTFFGVWAAVLLIRSK